MQRLCPKHSCRHRTYPYHLSSGSDGDRASFISEPKSSEHTHPACTRARDPKGLRSQARGIYPSLCRLFSNRIAVMASMSGDPSMKAAFESGQTFAAATAAHVFHVEAEAVTEEMRRKAKMVNFGVLYGCLLLVCLKGLGFQEGCERNH